MCVTRHLIFNFPFSFIIPSSILHHSFYSSSSHVESTMSLAKYELFLLFLISEVCVGALSFGSFERNGPWMRPSRLLMSAQQEVMTEAGILARNQGHLTMASKQEIDDTKQKYERMENENIDDGVHSRYRVDLDTHGFGSILMENGVARVDNVLSEKTATTMRAYTNDLLLGVTAAVESGAFSRDHLFGNVANPNNRWDLLLPIEASEECVQCLCEVLHEGSPVSTAIESVLGKDAELYELSTLISDPGSQVQPLHPDIVYQDTVHPILTCFVALQDITEDMGPTVFMPKVSLKASKKTC